jgi:hypothetical protein
MIEFDMAVAEAMCRGWPARHPSPKKSPAPGIAMTPSTEYLIMKESDIMGVIEGKPAVKKAA